MGLTTVTVGLPTVSSTTFLLPIIKLKTLKESPDFGTLLDYPVIRLSLRTDN